MLLRHGRKALALHQAVVFRPLRPTLRSPFTSFPATETSRRLLSTQHDARPVTRRKSFDATSTFKPGRNLATAVDDYQPIEPSAYSHLQNSILPSFQDANNPSRNYELRGFDPSSPLVVPDDTHTPERQRINLYGVPGSAEEMIPLFEACIRVGKIDRAAAILKRLTQPAFEHFPREDLAVLHNRYLRASLDHLRLHPDRAQAEELRKWYELYIRKKGFPQTAETIACMLKSSLLSERDPERLSRLIHRYMGMVPGEAGLEVLSMAEILNDQDLAAITEICPTYNLSPDEATTPEPDQLAGPQAERLSTGSDQVPEVLSTPQKGFGLKSLKQTLSLFDEIPQNCDISTLPIRERREIQARLERDCVEAAITRWREENESLNKMGLNTAISHSSLNSRLYDWQTALEARVKDEMAKIDASEAVAKKTPEDYDRCLYGPFMRLSTPSRLSALTILSALSTVALTGVDKGIPVAGVIASLGKFVEEDIQVQLASAKSKSKSKSKQRRVVLAESAKGAKTTPESTNAPEPLLGNDSVRDKRLAEAPWPVAVKVKLGAMLLTALLETAKIKVVQEQAVTQTLIHQYQPAFSHALRLRRGKKIGMILLNKTLVTIMKSEPRGDYLAKHLPMVVPPEPWTEFNKGAFLESTSAVVRVKQGDKEQKLYAEAAISRGDMDQVFKGLDILGRTAWRINTPVFNVMLEAWNTGKAFANFPELSPDIAYPPEPELSDDPMARRNWIRTVKAIENKKGALHSQRCFMNFQLEIARAFRNQTFYFPHNVDFRGRAYPLPTYLNHMGADHVRGLLRFAKGRELGERGLQWLKVHLANVYGFDKASLHDRASFAMENLVNVFDSANNPLTGNMWWLKAEDPWQCLATCFELKAALESPEPAKYVSHLPIHQDGTCNGLQHYAALGGDTWGAEQVNLAPSDKPADVYSAVANIVKDHIAQDVKTGNPIAMGLNGKITRKVVKQTVMTNVYGVTFSGARKQICKQLDASYPHLPHETGVGNLTSATYIAGLAFKALSTMFKGAHDIQYWLGEIGGRVCTAVTPEQMELIAQDGLPESSKNTRDEMMAQFRATIVWTTPLRMPVAQPYRKHGTRVIHTALQDMSFTVPERSDPVHRKKQLQAFPPNFIHSLDATHMLLSALECNDLGLDFAAVHDSFWTHAADVDAMSRVLRDAFIRIHEEDVVGRLATEFEARYGGSLYMARVSSGPIQKKITELRMAHRWGLKEEMLRERERQALLNSSDPKEVAKGQAMVTPASIFEEMAGKEDVITEAEELAGFGLGEISEVKAVDLDDASDEGAVDSEEADAGDAEQSTPDAGDRLLAAMIQKKGDNVTYFQEVLNKRPKKREPLPTKIWMPIKFPPVPAKGDFNVQSLKNSEYFFS
ncbi:DNA-dependent RNA polymerase [Colletotrichum camelliae]|nr:DNA-dependent RNA polymerase [Colletotrichum camelliae]